MVEHKRAQDFEDSSTLAPYPWDAKGVAFADVVDEIQAEPLSCCGNLLFRTGVLYRDPVSVYLPPVSAELTH